MKISARSEYAVRAAAQLAAAGDNIVTAQAIAEAQGIPQKFLEGILTELRRGGVVVSRRGLRGGYSLGRSPHEVSIADIVRAVDGPLVFVRGERPTDLTYDGPAESLLNVWIALRASVRSVLDRVTLAHLIAGDLPQEVRDLLADDAAWENP